MNKKFDKELLSISINLKMRELSEKHIKAKRKLDENFAGKGLSRLGSTNRTLEELYESQFKEILDSGKELPEYLKSHPIYYAGPAKTPPGKASGSFGPTTAGRMDSYVDLLQANGGSMVMIAKGNRSQQVTDACKKHGGFYLGSIGGPAALLAEENIKKVECIDFPELGMEAVWKIEVVAFPAFILVDDKGNDFFKALM